MTNFYHKMDNRVKKWKPVMDVMGIKETDYELVANYAEQHTKYMSVADEKDNMLPMSLKVLQKLLETNIRIKLSDKPLDMMMLFSVRIENDGLPLGTDHYEHLAIEEIVKILSEKSNKQKLTIYKLIDRIKSDQDTRCVEFYSNIRITTREDKLNRILK